MSGFGFVTRARHVGAEAAAPCFVGWDLSDPFARAARPVDVARLEPSGRVCFEQICWPRPFERAALAERFAIPRGAVVVVDGPQALSGRGKTCREAERVLRTPGRTPDALPDPGRPYMGFTAGSVRLFDALERAGARLLDWGGDLSSANLFEAFPGAAWRALSPDLPDKRSREGRGARKRRLEREGLSFGCRLPTPDQLDAALCAWLGFLARTRPDRLVAVGSPLFRDGWLREGRVLHLSSGAAQTRTRRARRRW